MKHLFVVLTNAAEGREDEFNSWYDDKHIGDVLQIPGVKAARRFKLSDQQRNPPPYQWGYLALYEIETDDLKGVMAEMDRRRADGRMPLTDAMAPATSFFFQPLGEWREE